MDYKGHIGHRVVYAYGGVVHEGTLVADLKYAVRVWDNYGNSKIISKIRVISLSRDDEVPEGFEDNV